ncbi:hypothetical protein HanXRQr2_Chr11g0469011 [Helianthus annuus]|uniref:Uncharacterized protein n=1 Tax=Helianthus annuus TaxID=4232 RepID=A0A251T7I4_HELAN|nr:homeobox protein 2 [Helianthus annuus]KAF5780178.1 hypothetical protein HanXRQr2_Chr11g0469011 [Helianthus annuus]KAJ0500038.1 hypothetical protein HanHA300_Chr11g0385261 [Helianthus annuus]KAJ0515865.1 hypothetical protein HanHA89_Chr11g0407541 [Helianthus annuus]KAJ0687844.1 hypothetical protein HanOQP8_Chr11g0387891 [Helianthus annuus]
MTTIRYNNNWVQFNSHENQCFEDEHEEQEETLSLSDLPTNNHQIYTSSNTQDNDQEDFEFGSGHANATFRSPDNMCTADQVFFQGQILPLRHSIGSMSVVNDPKTKIRNQFHSHPSPSPQIRTRTRSFRTLSRSTSKTTSILSFLQVGLVKPREIGLADLKNRSKRSGSYNSNSSSNSNSNSNSSNTNSSSNSNSNNNSSGMNMNSGKDKNHNQKQRRKNTKNTKKKRRVFLGGCDCAADSIERTIKERAPKESTMVGNGNGNGRQTASRHRTFEWLKQLSIAAPSEA